ncbi:MAG: hypothetical protein JNL57_03140 [Bacteroidetes bacterium]|nr:hypothetical protein [Bacteroidota bacterium]
MSHQEYFENQYIRFEIREGILYAWYRKGAVIDLNAAHSIVSDRLNLLKGRKMPMLLQDEGIKEVKREARIYMSKAEGIEGVSAGAFIVTNPFTKMVVQFFLVLNNDNVIPTKIFRTEEEALAWLQTYK